MHLNTTLDLDMVAIEAQDQVSVLLELAAPAAETANPRPPSTLQVVLDRSASMAGGALQSAKTALIDLVGRLEPTDHFGLVLFDDEVHVAVPAAPLRDKDAVRALIANIRSGRTTNLSGGYLRGLQEARRVAGDGGATLVLLSDGHANVGITDADKLGTAAADARGHRMTTSTIGLGLGYDESLLASLARGGAGNTHFAEEGDTAAAALASEVDGLLSQVAQAASLTVRPSGAVRSITLFNDLPTVGVDGGFMVELGNFHSGEQRKLLLEIEVPAMATLGLAQVCELELLWVDLDTMSTQKVTIPVNVNVVPGDEAAGRIANPVVSTERAFQQAQRDKQAATDALRAGEPRRAKELFSSAAAALGGFADPELKLEANVLNDLAHRVDYDDVSRTAKYSEADRHRKTRRRG
jgi:Ca-activated chloride channel family protein